MTHKHESTHKGSPTKTARELMLMKRAREEVNSRALPEQSEEAEMAQTRSHIDAVVAGRQEKTPASVPAIRSATVVTAPDNRPYRDRYLDEVAPASVVGRMVKFSKEGKFVTPDDDQEIPESAEFIALCGETLIGWVKFNGVGEPPDRVMGLLYDGFVMPPRDTLGDNDESQWSEGLDGKPADPWQHHQYLVLQDNSTSEMFTFVTSSQTGRRAVGNLLRHFNRTQKSHPGELPVVRLRTGGFQHKTPGIGFVNTPVFVVCGRSSRDDAAKPDTSVSAFIDDELPL